MRRGKTWLLYFSNIIAFAYGVVCLLTGMIFQINGKSSLEAYFNELQDSPDPELRALTLEEKNELFDFLVQSQTLMVCLCAPCLPFPRPRGPWSPSLRCG